jgi:hypothetical protein
LFVIGLWILPRLEGEQREEGREGVRGPSPALDR